MSDTFDRELHYTIMNPTGNLTALAEGDFTGADRLRAAAVIMERHPEVEQVGFVRFEEPGDASGGEDAVLNMAGGEFCGNASMSAAALYLMRCRESYPDDPEGAIYNVQLKVSGVADPVLVRLRREKDRRFTAGVKMPPARFIEYKSFSFDGMTEILPLVTMEGIAHVIVEDTSAFYSLLTERERAEEAVRLWCGEMHEAAAGIMFIDQMRRLTPLVHVPAGDTMIWENSCASGTSAAGMYLADRTYGPVDETFSEPGGYLRVMSDPLQAGTWLFGSVKCLESF